MLVFLIEGQMTKYIGYVSKLNLRSVKQSFLKKNHLKLRSEINTNSHQSGKVKQSKGEKNDVEAELLEMKSLVDKTILKMALNTVGRKLKWIFTPIEELRIFRERSFANRFLW